MFRLGQQDPERGATAVLFSFLALTLVGAVGLGVDMAANVAKRQELQNAADAGALAAAQELAVGGSETAAEAIAAEYAHRNMGLGDGNVVPAMQRLSATQVRVVTEGVQEHWFIRVLGKESSELSASATVEWGQPVAGTALLPYAISICSYYQYFGSEPVVGETYNLVPTTPDQKTGCSWHETYPPGGFGWLDPSPGAGCGTYTEIGAPAPSMPGKGVPNVCKSDHFKKLVDDQTVFLLPVFDSISGNGNNATYHIAGYAAIILRGYHINQLSGGDPDYGVTCVSNNEKVCIRAEFRGYVGPGDSWELGPGDDPAIDIIRLID